MIDTVDCLPDFCLHPHSGASGVASETASTSSNLPYAGKKAIVVGAGPAGSTAAMYLAREGFSVDVFERRDQPEADRVDNGRAYIIILVPRGKAALEEVVMIVQYGWGQRIVGYPW